MGKSSKAPAAPDPRETARADAEVNRVDVYGPQGIQQQYGWSYNGNFIAGPQPNGQPAAIKLHETPFDSWLRQTGEGIASNLAGFGAHTAANLGQGVAAPTAAAVAGTPRPYAPTDEWLPQRATAPTKDGLPAAAVADDAVRARVEKALFDRSASLMGPEIARQDRSLQTRLQGMGIPIGSEAFNDTYGDFTTKTNDAWGRLAMDAVIGGGAEQTRDYQLKADARSRALAEQDRDYQLKADARARAMAEQDRTFQYGNTVRDNAIRDAATFYDFSNNARGRDLSELQAILGGAYTPAPTVGNPSTPRIDVQGPINTAYQGQLAGWQAKNQSNAGLWSGLASLGGAAIIASSRTLKTDLGAMESEIAADMVERMPIHAWKYRDHTPMRDNVVHIGPWAEDFHEITGAGSEDGIFATDPAGLALAALKGAFQRIRELEAKVQHLMVEQVARAGDRLAA